MSTTRNTVLFGAALVAGAAAIAVDTYQNPVPRAVTASVEKSPTGTAPCAAAAPCSAGAVSAPTFEKSAPPPPPAAKST